MHRSSNVPDPDLTKKITSVDWIGIPSVEDWIHSQPLHRLWKDQFEKNGFLVIDSLLSEDELGKYRDVYRKLFNGEIDASAHRHDLGNHEEKKQNGVENICQIMWPTVYVHNLDQGPIHQRCLAISKIILGEDMAFDFDMLLAKSPHTDTPTPWHQDESYWLDLPDKRASSFWVAMDETTLDNGCMWFGAGSHKMTSIRPHRPAKPGVHVLTCDGSESEGTPCPLKPGGATVHSGRTLHYSRGNTTDTMRRGFIVNFRPSAMVEYERNNNFDHGKKGLTDVLVVGQTHQKDKE